MYNETTRDILVTVSPYFLEDQSSPSEDHFVWAYHVRIENQGSDTVQLLNRNWKITDALGRDVGEAARSAPAQADSFKVFIQSWQVGI